MPLPGQPQAPPLAGLQAAAARSSGSEPAWLKKDGATLRPPSGPCGEPGSTRGVEVRVPPQYLVPRPADEHAASRRQVEPGGLAPGSPGTREGRQSGPLSLRGVRSPIGFAISGVGASVGLPVPSLRFQFGSPSVAVAEGSYSTADDGLAGGPASGSAAAGAAAWSTESSAAAGAVTPLGTAAGAGTQGGGGGGGSGLTRPQQYAQNQVDRVDLKSQIASTEQKLISAQERQKALEKQADPNNPAVRAEQMWEAKREFDEQSREVARLEAELESLEKEDTQLRLENIELWHAMSPKEQDRARKDIERFKRDQERLKRQQEHLAKKAANRQARDMNRQDYRAKRRAKDKRSSNYQRNQLEKADKFLKTATSDNPNLAPEAKRSALEKAKKAAQRAVDSARERVAEHQAYVDHLEATGASPDDIEAAEKDLKAAEADLDAAEKVLYEDVAKAEDKLDKEEGEDGGEAGEKPPEPEEDPCSLPCECNIPCDDWCLCVRIPLEAPDGGPAPGGMPGGGGQGGGGGGQGAPQGPGGLQAEERGEIVPQGGKEEPPVGDETSPSKGEEDGTGTKSPHREPPPSGPDVVRPYAQNAGILMRSSGELPDPDCYDCKGALRVARSGASLWAQVKCLWQAANNSFFPGEDRLLTDGIARPSESMDEATLQAIRNELARRCSGGAVQVPRSAQGTTALEDETGGDDGSEEWLSRPSCERDCKAALSYMGSDASPAQKLDCLRQAVSTILTPDGPLGSGLRSADGSWRNADRPIEDQIAQLAKRCRGYLVAERYATSNGGGAGGDKRKDEQAPEGTTATTDEREVDDRDSEHRDTQTEAPCKWPFRVRIRAFIPLDRFWFVPFGPLIRVPPHVKDDDPEWRTETASMGPFGGASYRTKTHPHPIVHGDGRGFSESPDEGTHRVMIAIDTGPPDDAHWYGTSSVSAVADESRVASVKGRIITETLIPSPGSYTARGFWPNSRMRERHRQAGREFESDAEAVAMGSFYIPIDPMTGGKDKSGIWTAPAIDLRLRVTFTRLTRLEKYGYHGLSQVRVFGLHDGFPAYEVFVSIDCGPWIPAYQYNPIEHGRTPTSLINWGLGLGKVRADGAVVIGKDGKRFSAWK